MQVQIILINNILLTGIYLHVQAIPVHQKYNFVIELTNNTDRFNFQTNSSLCISDNNCPNNSWCNQNKCKCKKGWLTLKNNKKCSYKQISKSSTFIVSLLIGGAGIDWFILSRKNSLYTLTGLLKFLVSIAGCIWTRLAIINRTEKPMIVAGYFGTCLTFISVIWWAIDWIRILFNHFPDGNGAQLI